VREPQPPQRVFGAGCRCERVVVCKCQMEPRVCGVRPGCTDQYSAGL
jgi:hypothetical protein